MQASRIRTSLEAWGLLAHLRELTTPPGGSLPSRRLAPRQLRAGLGSDLRCPRDTPAASSRLCCPHLVPTYPPRPLPRPSRCGCGLLGSSSSCPKMNEAELSPQGSCVSEPDPTTAQGHLTSFRPKRNATEHRFLLGSRLRYWLCPSLISAHNWGGLQSLYFGMFLYQVHIVATVAGVSRRFACLELPIIILRHT